MYITLSKIYSKTDSDVFVGLTVQLCFIYGLWLKLRIANNYVREQYQQIPRAAFHQTFSQLLLEVQSDYADSIRALTVNMVVRQNHIKEGTIELKGVSKSSVMWVYAFSLDE